MLSSYVRSTGLVMAKYKEKKASQRNAQSHLRARLDYLHRAAAYLQSATSTSTSSSIAGESIAPNSQESQMTEEQISKKRFSSLTASIPRQYISHMRGASLKSQLRLPMDVKRSFCKRCDLLLTPGVTCEEELTNASKGARKPWADVLSVCCNACRTVKRYPRAPKRSEKEASLRERMKQNAVGPSEGS